jgi:hypothetical protein
MNKLHIITMVLVLLSLPAFANTHGACNPTFDDGAGVYFASSLDVAKDALSGICNAINNGGITENALSDTLAIFHQEIQKEAREKLPQLSGYLYIFDTPLFDVQGDIATGSIPGRNWNHPDPMNPNKIDKITLFYQGTGPLKKVEVKEDVAQSCFDDDDCNKALEAYIGILKDVYNPLSLGPLKLSLEYLTLKDKEWMTFLEEARSQTFIDIAVTSGIYEWWYGKGEHDFRSPPEAQWFAFHPSVLIESVKDAVDGEQRREALALEFGFNYWKDACFGYACGASLIVSYADRNGVEDNGWGLMLHADNSYSFGVTKYGGEEGFFVTIDLLELIIDKKSSFDAYKNKYRSEAK